MARKYLSIKTREHEVQAAILEYLAVAQRMGLVVNYWRANAGAWKVESGTGKARTVRINFVGCPDILGVLPGGKLLAIEVKAGPKSPITKAQASTLATWQSAGALAFVAWTIDQVREQLERPDPFRPSIGAWGPRTEHPHGCEGSAL